MLTVVFPMFWVLFSTLHFPVYLRYICPLSLILLEFHFPVIFCLLFPSRLFSCLAFCFLVLVIISYLMFPLELLFQQTVSVYLRFLAFFLRLVLLICLTLLQIISIRFSKIFIDCFANFIAGSPYNTLNLIFTKWNSCLVYLPTLF